MLKKIFASITLSVLFLTVSAAFARPADTAARTRPARKMAYKGFTGGMMLHTGYMFSGNAVYTIPNTGETFTQRTQGVPFGIGGAVKIQFGRHLRIGGEGYVTNLTHGKHKSHASVGWGGALAECFWDFNQCRLFLGGILGGGSQRTITLLEDTPADFTAEQKVSHRKYAFMAIEPYLGVEISLTRRINLVFKTDYMFNLSNPQKDFMTGPRLFLGILFSHSK